MSIDAITATILTTAALMLIALLRHLGASGLSRVRRLRARDRPDTIAAWPPQAARVLGEAELEALALARRAAPGLLPLCQVPLWRFVRVSTHHAYARWLARAGHLSADLLLCDERGRVRVAIDFAAEPMSARSVRRHRRLRRVLKAAGIPVLVWQLGRLPSLVKARAELVTLGLATPPARDTPASSHVAAAPRAAAELDMLLARGDLGTGHEPAAETVSSDFYVLHAPQSTLL